MEIMSRADGQPGFGGDVIDRDIGKATLQKLEWSRQLMLAMGTKKSEADAPDELMDAVQGILAEKTTTYEAERPKDKTDSQEYPIKSFLLAIGGSITAFFGLVTANGQWLLGGALATALGVTLYMTPPTGNQTLPGPSDAKAQVENNDIPVKEVLAYH